ncbi:MAG TPA: Type 1 glutamine amidotransferase-like domain-containing protein [Candidatus Nanopelagicales bacterium]|nr:Type 1 glutamine amidotransferase-like domain-containing protein [Candidatus Nanopelagicales bacterium]
MKGAILFNGNAESEDHLIRAAAPLLLTSRHADPAVAASRRVLLVTAGWAEHEHDEAHVKRALNDIGLPSDWRDGFDHALTNLSLLAELNALVARAPELGEAWAELRRAEQTARRFYLEHNAHLLALFRRTLREARDLEPHLSVPLLLSREGPTGGARPLTCYALARQLRQALATLEANDDHLFQLLGEIERRALDAAGLAYHPAWRAARERLEHRILTASSILLFGGRLDLLLDALRFFRLRDPLAEALRRGAQLVAMSAGAMVLCQRVIVYDDFAETPRDFQLYDRGLELVRDLQLFPHCMERIQTDDPDNLAYLARRFRNQVCVGLNQRSFLLMEPSPPRATSWGTDDAVVVFGPDGAKHGYRAGEQVPFG